MGEITIAKKAKRKDAFKFKDEHSIEEFLKTRPRDENSKFFEDNLAKAFHIEGNDRRVDTLEVKGGEPVNYGDIVAFEKVDVSTNCPNGVNCWILGKNAKIKIDEQGVIWTKPEPLPACEFNEKEEVESFIRRHSTGSYFEDNITLNDSSISIKTSWGISEGEAGMCLIVNYSTNDFNVLNKNTPSYNDYEVVD